MYSFVFNQLFCIHFWACICLLVHICCVIWCYRKQNQLKLFIFDYILLLMLHNLIQLRVVLSIRWFGISFSQYSRALVILCDRHMKKCVPKFIQNHKIDHQLSIFPCSKIQRKCFDNAKSQTCCASSNLHGAYFEHFVQRKFLISPKKTLMHHSARICIC